MDFALVGEYPRDSTQLPVHPCNQYSRCVQKLLCIRNCAMRMCRDRVYSNPRCTLPGNQDECHLGTVRVVQVQQNPPVYFEYPKPACVEFALKHPNKVKKIVDH